MGLFNFLKKEEKKEIKSEVASNLNIESNIILNNNHDYTEEEKKALFLYSMDYPSEVLNNNYSKKFQYEFNIENCKQLHEKLINEGYFEIAKFDDIVGIYKINEIKELLDKYVIKYEKEKKEQLIELAKNNITEEDKKEISKELGLYVLSNKAKEYLLQYEDLIYLYNHKNWAIPYWLFKNYKREMESYFKRGDIIWAIFNDRLNDKNASLSNCRGIYNDMAEFLENENKNIDSLYYYIICLYLDVNLYFTQNRINSYYNNQVIKVSKESILETIYEDPISEKIVEKINKLSRFHNEKVFQKLFSNINLPVKIFNDTEFKNIVNDIYTESQFNIKKYNDIAVSRMKTIIKDL